MIIVRFSLDADVPYVLLQAAEFLTHRRELRAKRIRDRGLTYDATSVMAGGDIGVISRIVNGKRRGSRETIVRLARALRISARRLQAMAGAAYAAAHSDGENAA